MTTEAFEVQLTDAGGVVTAVPIKSGRPTEIPRVVVWGGVVYLLEHSTLAGGPGARKWVGMYRERPVFVVEDEGFAPRLHDPEEVQLMMADAVTASLQLAGVCVKCGSWRCSAKSIDPHARPCCSSCTHEHPERCGAVSKAQRGVADGLVCLLKRGHGGELHQSGKAAWWMDPTLEEAEAELVAKDQTFFRGRTVRRCCDCRKPVLGGPSRCEACVANLEPARVTVVSELPASSCAHNRTHRIDGGDMCCSDCGANLYTEHLAGTLPEQQEPPR